MRVYLVQRRGLREVEWEGFEAAEHPGGGFPPWKTLRVFASQEAARAFADEVLRGARREVAPLEIWSSRREMTSLDEDEFCLRVAELGLPLPPADWNDFYDWWPGHVKHMSEEQRDGVWALLDRLELVRVTAIPLDESFEESP